MDSLKSASSRGEQRCGDREENFFSLRFLTKAVVLCMALYTLVSGTEEPVAEAGTGLVSASRILGSGTEMTVHDLIARAEHEFDTSSNEQVYFSDDGQICLVHGARNTTRGESFQSLYQDNLQSELPPSALESSELVYKCKNVRVLVLLKTNFESVKSDFLTLFPLLEAFIMKDNEDELAYESKNVPADFFLPVRDSLSYVYIQSPHSGVLPIPSEGLPRLKYLLFVNCHSGFLLTDTEEYRRETKKPIYGRRPTLDQSELSRLLPALRVVEATDGANQMVDALRGVPLDHFDFSGSWEEGKHSVAAGDIAKLILPDAVSPNHAVVIVNSNARATNCEENLTRLYEKIREHTRKGVRYVVFIDDSGILRSSRDVEQFLAYIGTFSNELTVVRSRGDGLAFCSRSMHPYDGTGALPPSVMEEMLSRWCSACGDSILNEILSARHDESASGARSSVLGRFGSVIKESVSSKRERRLPSKKVDARLAVSKMLHATKNSPLGLMLAAAAGVGMGAFKQTKNNNAMLWGMLGSAACLAIALQIDKFYNKAYADGADTLGKNWFPSLCLPVGTDGMVMTTDVERAQVAAGRLYGAHISLISSLVQMNVLVPLAQYLSVYGAAGLHDEAVFARLKREIVEATGGMLSADSYGDLILITQSLSNTAYDALGIGKEVTAASVNEGVESVLNAPCGYPHVVLQAAARELSLGWSDEQVAHWVSALNKLRAVITTNAHYFAGNKSLAQRYMRHIRETDGMLTQSLAHLRVCYGEPVLDGTDVHGSSAGAAAGSLAGEVTASWNPRDLSASETIRRLVRNLEGSLARGVGV